MEQSRRYVVFMADIVDSSSLDADARHEVQRSMADLVSDLDESYRKSLDTRLVTSAGDAIQTVVRDLAVIPDLLWGVWDVLDTVEVRVGIGAGPIHTPFAQDPRVMDGPAFHRAAAHPGNHPVVCRGFGRSGDVILGGLGGLLRTTFERFTDRQREALRLLREGAAQNEIATVMGVSKQAVSALVKKSGWAAYERGEAALRESFVLFDSGDQMDDR